jgi:hypothetical protein
MVPPTCCRSTSVSRQRKTLRHGCPG